MKGLEVRGEGERVKKAKEKECHNVDNTKGKSKGRHEERAKREEIKEGGKRRKRKLNGGRGRK